MKKITMIKSDYCPYCRRAFQFMDSLYMDNPEFKNIDLKMLDETTDEEEANKFPYKVVPTYIIDNKIIFSGIPTKEDIKQVFEKSMR